MGLALYQRAGPEECLWEAPDGFSTKRPLKALYVAAGLDADNNDVQRFFQDTLGIPNISHEHIIVELQHLATSDHPEGTNILEKVRNLYHLLQDLSLIHI